MIKAIVSLYLVSKDVMEYLVKDVEFHVLPRTGEFVKLQNAVMGDYFPFEVGEITHREGSLPEISLKPLMQSESDVDFFEPEELKEYVSSYVQEGWEHKSTKENKIYKIRSTSSN